MNCIFCKIAAKELATSLVYEDEHVVAFQDLNPQAPTHLLLIPKEHIATLNDADPAHKNLLGHLMLTAKDIAKKLGHDEKGYRLNLNCNGEGGQTVFHLHLHLLAGRQMHWPPG